MTAITPHSSGDEGWFSSSFCLEADACVEVRFEDGMAYLRSTLDSEGRAVPFNRTEWEAFVLGVWNGEFDMPA